MMRIAIMQPYFFPYIGYFQLINAVDKFICYDDVNFIKRGWINRNKLLINGKDNYISVPLKKASQNKKINEIIIDDEQDWRGKLLKTISLNYGKAPHFNHVFPWVKELLSAHFSYIHELALSSIEHSCQYLGITKPIVRSTSVYQNDDLKGQDRILSICKKENATTYINPIGGITLYDKDMFRKNNLELKFIQSKEIRYEQGTGEFVPWLSILDVMMHNSAPEVQSYLKN